jgi:hypothetical protein
VARGVLDLAEDLRLADHHRVEPAGHPEHVADRVALRVGIQVGRDLGERETVKARQPVGRVLRLLGRKVEFGAVAGRQDRRLAHRIRVREIVQGLDQPLRLERDAFADGERCGVVIQAKGEKLHAEREWIGASRIIAPSLHPKIEPNQPPPGERVRTGPFE